MGELTRWTLDAWSLYHICGWFVVSFFVSYFYKLQVWKATLLSLTVGVSWELIEWSVVEKLLDFHEPWWNRWVSDLIVDTLGGYLGVVLAKRQRVRIK